MKPLVAQLKHTVRSVRASFEGDHTLAQRANFLAHQLLPRTTWAVHQPVTISIIATSRCNLACEMCPTHSKKVPRTYLHIQGQTPDMSIDMFRKITKRFPLATTVNFIGSGEPLMIDDFYQIVEHAVASKMVIKSFSNGVLVGEHAERLARSSLDGLNISINSDDPEDFKRVTAMPQHFHTKILANVRRLREEVDRTGSKLKVKGSFILDRRNYRRIGEMIRLADELRLDRLYFGNYLGNPYGGMSAQERSLWDDQEMLDFFRDVQIPAHMKHVVHLPELLRRNATERSCTCHWDQIRVNGSGELGCCSVMLLESYIGGHVTDEKIFNKKEFRARRARFLSNTAKLEAPCYHCTENIGRSAVG